MRAAQIVAPRCTQLRCRAAGWVCVQARIYRIDFFLLDPYTVSTIYCTSRVLPAQLHSYAMMQATRQMVLGVIALRVDTDAGEALPGAVLSEAPDPGQDRVQF